MSGKIQVVVSKDRIAAFCPKWKITELALFGSVLREDFRPDSDVDVLVTFSPDSDWGVDHRQHQPLPLGLWDRTAKFLGRVKPELHREKPDLRCSSR